MRAILLQRWERVRGSYWFLPSLMTLGAIVCSVMLIKVDETVGPAWLETWHYLYENKPDGARALLSTIAGSMIGVAGVTFSITIAAVAYASSSFGPRIISNFMRDTGNQITLGTFIATYVYCLLVLRTVRSGDEGGFVPHVSVFFGVILALASLGVLIFFIHHIPESIHVDHVIAGIGKEMLETADSLFEDKDGESEEDHEREATGFQRPTIVQPATRLAIPAPSDGFVQSIDMAKLRKLAADHEVGLVLMAETGTFVARGGRLLEVDGQVDKEKLVSALQGCFVQGSRRAQVQDLFFLIDQMVDIAARALSPGTNDPFTAMASVDWLCALLTRLASRQLPRREWRDGPAWVRLSRDADFRRYVEASWGRLRPYVEKDRNAALHMLDQGLATLPTLTAPYAVALAEGIHSLVEGCLRQFEHSSDKAALQLRRERLAELTSSDMLLRQPDTTDL